MNAIFKSLTKISIAIFLVVLAMNLGQIRFTNSSLADKEKFRDNSFEVGTWDMNPDVVINEIMWMGSKDDSGDEWIELRNMTDEDIDISNWNIENAGTGGGHIEIPNGYSIKANKYFLIINNKWDETAVKLTADLHKNEGYTHVAGMNLHNDGEQLILKDKDNKEIDKAWISTDPRTHWPAGESGTDKKSMERIDNPIDGTLASEWKTCADSACNDGTYWDTVDGNNFGTPGAANLLDEENDLEANNETIQTLDAYIEEDLSLPIIPNEEITPPQNPLPEEPIVVLDDAVNPDESGEAADSPSDENSAIDPDLETQASGN